jgi:hypothetical protein
MSTPDLIKRLTTALRVQLDGVALHQELLAEADAALAQPEGEGPSDQELASFLADRHRARMESESAFGCPDFDGAKARAARIADARAVLARWGRAVTPPAPEPKAAPEVGEVAELVVWLTMLRDNSTGIATRYDERLARIATLLQQPSEPAPAVVPVAVSERPWEREGWRDAEGRCWWGRPSEELCNSDWFLATRDEVEDFCSECMPIVSLPHNAIPLPQAGEVEA